MRQKKEKEKDKEAQATKETKEDAPQEEKVAREPQPSIHRTLFLAFKYL